MSFWPRDVSGLLTILASHLGQSRGILPFTGRVASKGEIDYAYFADKTPHIVLSKTLDQVDWKNTRIVRDVEEIRRLKQRSGKDIYAVGGATLVSGLMNMGLIDEVRFLVNPFILGGGKTLFKDVKDRHVLKLVQAKAFKSGKVNMTNIAQPDIKVLDSEKW